MSDNGAESHKRSKSALAKSLLHRDKAKQENTDGDVSSVAGSESGSGPPSPNLEPTPHRTFGALRSSKHRNKSSTALSEAGNPSAAALARDAATQPQTKDVKPSIQQSVRMFKLFEVLRSGDSAAIAKAVTDTSTMPPITEDGEQIASVDIHPGTLEGTTLLHLAIQCADPPVVEEVLAVAKMTPGAAVDVNARDKDGNTPLHLASMLGRPTTVRLLLDQPGINDSLPNYLGKTALDLARSPEIFQQLQLSRSLYVERKIKEIQTLVAKQKYDQLEKVLEDSHVEASLDVNGGELATNPATLQTGGTLLHDAAREKDFKLIQLLLLHGADPFRRDRKGKLPQDVTKDERTKAILKKSPAAAAAQRGIQEKAVLGSGNLQAGDDTPGGKEAREMKGYLKKWTNYTSGWKLRWFVLEDGVLSYYKYQDDAGSACRGAINMKIAKLHMDPQDKTKFDIEGKSSVKYNLKANHVVEAKRWFWSLNNAIQSSKDEVKKQERHKKRKEEMLHEARSRKPVAHARTSSNSEGTRLTSNNLAPATAVGVPLTATSSRVSLQESTFGPPSVAGDDNGSMYDSQDQSVAGDTAEPVVKARTTAIAGDVDDEEEYGEDASSHEMRPASKDAFNITAHSASLQLSLLSQVSAALQTESHKENSTSISDPTILQALSTYESAVASLQGLVNDLLKISRDRDAYWQYRLDREADVRRLWEDSMARVAKEQEELEGRIEESEEKRKRTKRALKDALEGQESSRPQSRDMPQDVSEATGALNTIQISRRLSVPGRRKSISNKDASRRKSTIADFTNLSDSDSDEDEEFFDAVDAGEVEVVDIQPESLRSPPLYSVMDGEVAKAEQDGRDHKREEIKPSFHGYEDPIRQKLKLDNDDRPKISLWGILKSMIGKDMTKMTLPVSFNEPTSLLQRVTEDLEYTDLIDTAADRSDSSERMVYVAAYAASEYASTIGRIAKPFNPLLGETYEYVRPDKGYRFLVEQVSHHPPVGAAWADSPKWDYYGESALKSKFYGKSFEINLLGTWFLKVRPTPTQENPNPKEELYTWKKVTSSVVGIITGNPTVDNYGPMEIRNHTTGDVCYLDFKQRGWKASSAYQVSGKVVCGKDGKTRWSIGGRWNDKIYARLTPGFEDSALSPPATSSGMKSPDPSQAFLVWEAHERPPKIPFNLTPFVVTFMSLPDRLRPYLPPTDTRLRPDQRAMEDGEYDVAANEKTRVEEKQRAKRRERETNGEEHRPRWFKKAKCDITGEEFWRNDGEYWKVREDVGQGKGEWSGVEDIF
ncbi:uncharacterized protein KY384_006492 [Bacidia gigantensis]|uniref:uncharacterized protein n=1 Tax=Bacidia gigantensis TaxID=2732470 RepID=UPI001D03F452|nr:uncharacterized protein KY384_006492 [Bacidia gigantensis]KAG8528803.1 hypothetical protein KY384_006492 [Bacidia gigantensis]